MKQPKTIRDHWIHLRLTKDEFEQIEKAFKQTTCRQQSEWIRDVLLKKPITVRHRNQSADEFLSVALRIKNELNAIGHNYNQAVKKLHLLRTAPDMQGWIITYESAHKILLEKVKEINVKMDKIYQQWLLK